MDAHPDDPGAIGRANTLIARAAKAPPLVSVIIPTRDRPERLRVALASVLAQTYGNVEAIVVNDGGADVGAVVDAFADPRVVSVRHGVRRERSAARNTGLRLARGEYVAYLDDDDWYEPEHVETLVGALERGGGSVAYSDARRVLEVRSGDAYVAAGSDVPYSMQFDRAQLFVANYIPVLCVMHRRTCVDAVGGFDEELETHEDWDLLIRLARKWDFAHVPVVTCAFTWRQDGSSTTSGRHWDFVRTTERVHARYAAEVDDAIRAAQEGFRARQRATIAEPRFTCSVIVVVRNGVERTRRCLTALAEATRGLDYEVIVVDAGSTDGTSDFLAVLGGDVQVLRIEADTARTAAWNLGARVARGDHLVFLAPDSAPRDGWLQALVDELVRHPETAIVGGRLVSFDGAVRHAGYAVSRVHGGPYAIYRGFPASFPGVNRRREAQAVSADCLLVRREAFEAVGGFDEEYAERCADVDLCFAIRGRGGRVVYEPRCALWQESADDAPAADAADAERLQQRWGNEWVADEDATYVADGYVYRAQDAEGRLRERLEPLGDGAERARWERVAEAQRRAQRDGVGALRNLLDEPDAWPDDPAVLAWAAELCVRTGMAAHADRFRHRAHGPQ